MILFSSTDGDTPWVSFEVWFRRICEDAVEQVGLFFVAKKAGAQRFIVGACAGGHFLGPPSGPLLTGEGLCHVEFQQAFDDAQNWLVGSADIKNTFHQMRIPGDCWRFFALHAVLASEVGYTRSKTSRSRFFEITCPYDSSKGFFLGDVSDHCTHARSVDSPLFVCRDHSAPRLLGSKHGMGSVGFRWSYADILRVLARGANCTNVHLARLIASVQKVGLDVHDISLASGSADVLGYEVFLANASCSGTCKRVSRTRSVARTVSSRRRIGGRAMELVDGHESFLAISNRGALSILDANFKFARASYLIAGEASVNSACRAKSISRNPMSSPK